MKPTSIFLSAVLGSVMAMAVCFAQQPPATARPQGGQQPMGMPMPMMNMMQQMHLQEAAMGNDWTATGKGVFVVRAGQVLKYDKNLKLVKKIDLPKASTGADQTDQSKPQANRMGQMMRMMAQAHAALPVHIEATTDGLFISRGNAILKYDFNLDLKNQVDLPAVSTTTCPMCQQMMKMMTQRMQGGGQ